jgi:Uncharacterised nucleotidyltransferase
LVAVKKVDQKVNTTDTTRTEFDWLCAAASVFVLQRNAPDGRRAACSFPELDHSQNFAQRAATHGLLPLIHKLLENGKLQALPSRTAALAWAAYEANRRRNQVVAADVARVISTLASNGIAAYAHKGPALALWLYGDSALRVSSDIDVLVAPRHLFAAVEALAPLGYVSRWGIPHRYRARFLRAKQQHDLALDREGAEAHLELHWRTDPRFHAERLDATIAAPAVTIENVAIPQLPAKELMFALLVHGTKHKWERLAWLVDIALLAPKLDASDWQWLVDAGKERHCEIRLAVGLYLANTLLDVDIAPQNWTPSLSVRAKQLANELESTLSSQAEFRPLSWFEDFRGDLRFNDCFRQNAGQTLDLIFTPNLRDWHDVGDHPGALLLAFPRRILSALARRLGPNSH